MPTEIRAYSLLLLDLCSSSRHSCKPSGLISAYWNFRLRAKVRWKTQHASAVFRNVFGTSFVLNGLQPTLRCYCVCLSIADADVSRTAIIHAFKMLGTFSSSATVTATPLKMDQGAARPQPPHLFGTETRHGAGYQPERHRVMHRPSGKPCSPRFRV